MSPEKQQRRLANHGITLEQAATLSGHWREYFGLPYSPYNVTVFLDDDKRIHDAEDPALAKFGE